MAQVASALAGQPLRAATGISMTSPIVLSGQATAVLRICALRTEETISVIIRCDHTDFAVDHFSATFDCAAQPGAAVPGEPGSAGASDGPGKRGGLGKRGSSGKRGGGRSEAGASEIDAAEIYGPVCFQAGRFRRLTSVRVAGSRTAIGLADGSEQPPWFYPAPAAGSGLLLGDPGIADAALQLAQVCVPNRRLLFAGCESASFGDGIPDGLVTVTISQAELAEAAGGGAAAVPRPRDGEPSPVAVAQAEQAETVWDVEATDSAGHPVATLRGLRMRDAGSLPRTGPWPVPLLGCFLERSMAELGLDCRPGGHG